MKAECDIYFEVLKSLSIFELEEVLRYCIPDYKIEKDGERYTVVRSELSSSSAKGYYSALQFALISEDYEKYFFDKKDVKRLDMFRKQLRRKLKERQDEKQRIQDKIDVLASDIYKISRILGEEED